MRIQSEWMSFNNCWTISTSYDFQAHLQHSKRKYFSQTALLWFEVLLVLATGPGNPAAFWVWTAKTGRFGSRTVQKHDPLTLGGANPDPHPSVPISGFAFRVSYVWSHSDMLLWIVKYWHWYVKVLFRRISRLDVQNKHTHAPNHILKMSVNRASTELQQSVNEIWSCNLFCL